MDFTDVFQDLRIVFIIVGIALMVAGFLLHQLAIAIPGFIIGGIIGLLIGSLDNFDQPMLIGLLGGIAGAVIAIFFENLIIFILGAVAAIILLYFIKDDPSTFLIIVAGLIGGITALTVWKFCVVVITSIIGSFLFCGGTDTLDSSLPILLTLIGIAVQYGLIVLFPSLKKIALGEP
jgi:hypothetical protein